MRFRFREKYKLELRWDELIYHDETTAVLKGAYFAGPALKIAQEIEAPDQIDLDLTPQHFHVLGSYYIVRLHWDGVGYEGSRVLLKNARIVNQNLKSIHKLGNEDYILIDTEKHEEAVHAFNLVYDSQVMRPDKKPYRYT